MINIGICGQVSTGKSTGINAILGDCLSQTKMKRTTMGVFEFIHSTQADNSDIIKKTIEIVNDVSKKEKDNVIYRVKMPFVKNQTDQVKLIDFPGFNDGKEDVLGMEKLFYGKISQLDYIIYIIDATSPLLYKSEKTLITSILNKVIQNHKNNRYTRTIFVFNKYDDEGDDEITEMIDEAKQWLFKELKRIKLDTDNSWFFSVSFRKMMIYSVHKNNKKMNAIPKTVLMKALTEMYGRSTARKMIDTGENFDTIVSTKDESSMFTLLEKISDNQFNKYYMASKFKEKLDKISSLDQRLVTCIHNHLYIRAIDNEFYIRIIRAKLDKFERTMSKISTAAVVEKIKWFNIMYYIFKNYVSNSVDDANRYISDIYCKYLSNCTLEYEYGYIVHQFLNMNIPNWLNNDDIINNLDKYSSAFAYFGYSNRNCNEHNITNGKIVKSTKIRIDDLFNINTMKKVSKCNDTKFIYNFIEKMDYLQCKKLYNTDKYLCNNLHTHVQGALLANKGQIDQLNVNSEKISKTLKYLLFDKSKEYMEEKSIPSCARMEFNYIKHAKSNCGFRTKSYAKIKEYHDWSWQYTQEWTKQIIDPKIISLLPGHVINHIMMSRVGA